MVSVVLRPGDSIQAAINANPTGTTFYLEAGTYRGAQFTPKDGQTFIGAPGAVLNGAIQLSSWQQSDALWKHTGLPDPLAPAGYGANGSSLPTLREDLFVNDTLYKRVGSLAEVKDGTWYYDQATKTAYMSQNPAGATVEMSAKSHAINGAAANVTLKGLTVEKYANAAQTGAIQINGADWTVEGVTARFNHGGGLVLGKGTTVLGGHYNDNGQVGIGAWRADGAEIIGVEVARNNYANFDVLWDAGGLKLTESTGMTVKNSFIHHNNGPGLWFDVNMKNALVENNTIAENKDVGLLYEISYDGVIHGNTIVRNGQADPNGANWLNGQIRIQNSSNVDVYGNHIEALDGTGGIALLHENRGAGPYGAWSTQHNTIHDNEIVYLGSRILSGFQVNYQHDLAAGFGNSWDRNEWIVPDASKPMFVYDGWLQGWDSARRVSGLEPNGQLVVGQPAPTPATPPAGYDPGVVITPPPTTTEPPATEPPVVTPPPVEPPPVTGTGPDTIVVRASGDSYQGAPGFKLFADGKEIAGPAYVTMQHGQGWQDYTFRLTLPTGTKAVGVGFFNDFSDGPGLDRNLYVQSVSVNGKLVAATNEALYSNGIMDFAIPAAGTPTPVDNTTKIVVNASGSPAGGVNAHFNLLVDGRKIGEGFAGTTAQDFAFTADVTAGQAHKVQIQYDNDAVVNGQDRSLYVNKITINGKEVLPTAANVTYDKGALDGKDVVKGQPGLWWNGTLVVSADATHFPAGTGTAPPAPTTPTEGPVQVVVNASGSPAGGVNAHFNLLLDGKKVGEGVAGTTAKDFVFTANVTADQAHKVQIQYDNDAVVNGQDRSLYVNKITINGKAVAPTDSIVTYDKGALDGKDVVKGQPGLWWNGTLVVNADKSFFPATKAAALAMDADTAVWSHVATQQSLDAAPLSTDALAADHMGAGLDLHALAVMADHFGEGLYQTDMA